MVVEDLKNATKKEKNTLKTEDLLHYSIVNTTFPNTQQLIKIHLLIPMLEAIAEQGFSKMCQIIMIKRFSFDDSRL